LLATPGGFGIDETDPAASEEVDEARWQEELEEFVPSEEVPADQAISFPVDI
jgi:hypothetical protein